MKVKQYRIEVIAIGEEWADRVTYSQAFTPEEIDYTVREKIVWSRIGRQAAHMIERVHDIVSGDAA